MELYQVEHLYKPGLGEWASTIGDRMRIIVFEVLGKPERFPPYRTLF